MEYLTDHIQYREFGIYQALEIKFELNRLMTTCVEQKCKTQLDALKVKDGVLSERELRLEVYEQREKDPCFKYCYQPLQKISTLVQDLTQPSTDFMTREAS